MSFDIAMHPELQHLWRNQAAQIAWLKKPTEILEWQEPVANWFPDGLLNASYACVDAHAQGGRANKVALHWEDELGNVERWTYSRLFDEVNLFASVLQKQGVKKGDIVIVYLPLIPQAVAAMLAVARLGATHSVVFSGFSAQALRDRIDDTRAKLVITADMSLRRGKKIMLKGIVDQALGMPSSVQTVLVIKRDSQSVAMQPERDVFYHDAVAAADVYVTPVAVPSNHPLFILYTSGTTGKPKGIVHSTGGYLTYVAAAMKWAFNLDDTSVYWCTADIGWITGHSCVVYGPLLHGATMLMYEGAPDYPTASKWWELIEKYRVTTFYTSPTALRMFMRLGNALPRMHDLSSLRVLGSVGEVINPEVWQWYYEVIGQGNCVVVDTWWQTETGCFMIAPAPWIRPVTLKAGSATLPLPGIEADVVDAQGNSVGKGTKGFLVVKHPWPGMSIGIYNDQARFQEVYWSKFKGMYYSGDYAIRDEDGYFWLLGRADEVLNVAGHRIGTAEIESAAVSLPSIAEAAAIGVHDDVKGESVVLFAIVRQGIVPSDELRSQVIATVRSQIGAFVTPSGVYFVEKLPKTRSGKIMRRLLKAVIEDRTMGDLSTLEDEASIEEVKTSFQLLKQAVEGA